MSFRTTARLLFIVALFINIPVSRANQPEVIPLWSGDIPGPKPDATEPEQILKGADGLSRRFNVSSPRLLLHRPTSATNCRTAIIVVPGGGFARLSDEHEGLDACKWLNSLGVTAFQLVHRCPTHKHTEPNSGPVLDTQQAVELVRHNSEKWNIDTKQIGVLGFSAGGQVALVAATADRKLPSEANNVSYRPDFLMLLYPFRIYDEQQQGLRNDINLDAGLQPTFIAQCADDTASAPQGSTLLMLELVKRKVPAELHIYAKGGHGFGLRERVGATGPTDWPLRARDWLRQRKLINAE